MRSPIWRFAFAELLIFATASGPLLLRCAAATGTLNIVPAFMHALDFDGSTACSELTPIELFLAEGCLCDALLSLGFYARRFC